MKRIVLLVAVLLMLLIAVPVYAGTQSNWFSDTKQYTNYTQAQIDTWFNGKVGSFPYTYAFVVNQNYPNKTPVPNKTVLYVASSKPMTGYVNSGNSYFYLSSSDGSSCGYNVYWSDSAGTGNWSGSTSGTTGDLWVGQAISFAVEGGLNYVAPPPTTKDYVLRWEGSRSQPWYGYTLTNPYRYDITVDVTTNSNDVANANHNNWVQNQLTGKVTFYSTTTPLYDFWGHAGFLSMGAYNGTGANVYGPTDSRANGSLWGASYTVVHAIFQPDQAGYAPCYFDIDLSLGSSDGQVIHGTAGGGGYGTSETTPGTSTVLPSPGLGVSPSDKNNLKDQNTGIDFSPLQAVGNDFSTKFPFSVPWDMQRLVQSFNLGSPVTPVWNIAIDQGQWFRWHQTIDLSQWEQIMPWVRAFELVLFNLGLMLVLYKIKGGQS